MTDDHEQSSISEDAGKAKHPTFSRRKFLAASALGAAGLAVAGCGSGSTKSTSATTSAGSEASGTSGAAKTFSTKKRVTLQMWNQPTWSDAVTERQFWQQIGKKFTQQHSNVELEVSWISWDSSFAKEVAAIKAGNTPDFTQTGAEQMVSMAAANGVEPVDDIIAMMPESKWTNQIKYFKYDDHYYGVPYLIGCYIFYYRQDLLEKAGISSAPSTWPEWLDAATKAQNTSDGTYGMGLDYTLGASSDQLLQGIVYAAGGEILNKQKQVAFDSPQTAEAFKFYCQSVPDAKVLPPGVTALTSPTTMATPLDTLYETGRIVTALRWGIEALTYKAGFSSVYDKTAYALPPAGPSGHPGSFANDNPFWIFKASKNISWTKEFLRFFYEPANVEALVTQSGWLSPYSGISTALDDVPWFKTMNDTMPYAVRFGFDYGPEAQNGNAENAFYLGECAQQIFLQHTPVDTALAKYQKMFEQIYKLPGD
jgi:ABC-type glycerol-3-phosphate transport system substrate-binding protein